eukprot:119750-Prymnesium_polylepis.1
MLAEGFAKSTALKSLPVAPFVDEAIAAGLPQPSSARASRPASARRMDNALATGAAALATPSSKEPPVAVGHLPREQLLQYRALFHSKEEAPGDGLTDATAAQLLAQTGLPEETVSDIWYLSCEIDDGPLALDGFCVAMHLASCCKLGAKLPLVLPSSLHEPFP